MNNGTEPRTFRLQVWLGSLPIMSLTPPPAPPLGLHEHPSVNMEVGIRVRPQHSQSSYWFSIPPSSPGIREPSNAGAGEGS